MKTLGFSLSMTVNDAGASARLIGGSKRKGNKTPKKRGAVTDGLSMSARRRMLRFIMGFYVPQVPCAAISLTVRYDMPPEEWRAVVKAFRMWHVRAGVASVWRVELQRRGVPHLHLITYAESYQLAELSETWLSLWGLANDPDARKYAVHIQPDGENSAWLAYLALHSAKSQDRVQWQGRQWGIWNRRAYRERPNTWAATVDGLALWYVHQMTERISRSRGWRGGRSISGWDDLLLDRMTLTRIVQSGMRYAKKHARKPPSTPPRGLNLC